MQIFSKETKMKALLKNMWLSLVSLISPAITNYSPGPSGQTIANDIELHIADEVLRIAQRQLVAFNSVNRLKFTRILV